VNPETNAEISFVRELDAPRSLVYEVLTKPGYMKRWLGPAGWFVSECDLDLRPGGAWHFVMRSPKDVIMRGVFREVVTDKRIVTTESFDTVPGEYVVTTTLASRGNATLLTKTLLYPTPSAYQAALASGVERRTNESLDKLADYVVTGSFYGW
jgi:uncharacterized protein YndB with AHSA1/START domain